MSREIQRSFEVAVPVERAWKVQTDPEELNKWYFPIQITEDGTAKTEILGSQRVSEVVDFDLGRMFKTRTVLTGREGFGVLAGEREMTVVLEATEVGTRITITQSGFGDGADWERELEATARGMDETIADLILYLETGIAFPRHHRTEKSFHGIVAREVRTGIEVVAVQPDTFGARLGLEPGDLLVELGGATLFRLVELQFFTKVHGAGEQLDAAWIRNGELLRAKAELGARIPIESA